MISQIAVLISPGSTIDEFIRPTLASAYRGQLGEVVGISHRRRRR